MYRTVFPAILAGVMLLGCASEALTVTKEVSIYEVEGVSIRNISNLTRIAYEAIQQECDKRAGKRIQVASHQDVNALSPRFGASGSGSGNDQSTTVRHSADLLAFTEHTRDFLDIIFPKSKVKISMKCGAALRLKGEL